MPKKGLERELKELQEHTKPVNSCRLREHVTYGNYNNYPRIRIGKKYQACIPKIVTFDSRDRDDKLVAYPVSQMNSS